MQSRLLYVSHKNEWIYTLERVNDIYESKQTLGLFVCFFAEQSTKWIFYILDLNDLCEEKEWDGIVIQRSERNAKFASLLFNTIVAYIEVWSIILYGVCYLNAC